MGEPPLPFLLCLAMFCAVRVTRKLWLNGELCHAPSTASGLFILQQKDSSPPHLSGPVNKGSPFLSKVLCVQYKESGNFRNRDKPAILSSADITGECHPTFAC